MISGTENKMLNKGYRESISRSIFEDYKVVQETASKDLGEGKLDCNISDLRGRT